jgi:hypothetical protein
MTIELSTLAIIADLLAACEIGLKNCKCRGRGSYMTDCTLCGDSTFDHYCNDKKVECTDCVPIRAAIAKATKGGS